MNENPTANDLLLLTSDVVSAYVSNNRIESSGLVSLIQQVHKTLSEVGGTAEVVADKLVPAVPIKKSVFPSYLICLEDGKKLKMLKRHLATSYDMTPEQYRERWGLAHDYPMVAPEYASRRSELAKSIGLGRKPAMAAEIEAPAEVEVAPVVEAVPAEPKKRGRKKLLVES
jgi:predicted transcriptional regulator